MRLERLVTGLGGLTLLVSIGTGCGSDDAAPTPPVGFAGSPAINPVSPTGTTPATALPSGVASGAAGNTAPGTGVGTTPVTTAPAGALNVPGIPCDVASVVSENCTTCHTNPTKFQAPMPLMAHADFMAPSVTQPTMKVYQVIPGRINATDIKLRMPPASGTTIPAANLKVFNDWLASGAQPVTPSCPITVKGGSTPTTTPTSTTPGMPMTTPTTGEGNGATSPGGSGGASDMPIAYNDPMMKCYEFRAHADGDKSQPFSVSTQPDQYTNYTFMPPWKGMMYARSFRVLEGNPKVIHHWLFYKDVGPVTDGAVGFSTGAHPDGELIHGWAPGGSDLYFDSDVGLEMPSDVGYTLETHHNNTGTGPAPDNSGVEVCVTPTQPKNVASLSWLGTDSISGTSATGTCAPTSGEPVHIIGVQPHMHTKGIHMKGEITRANGMKEMLHDAPFDFQYQHSYHVMTTLMPGDSITTTCTYNAPTSFGEGTNDEMCYLFTLYYPKLSLTNGNPVATLIHGPNTCLQ